MDKKPTPPSIVLALAKHAATEHVTDPNPIDWHEYPREWVIVFEDGRKLHFEKAAVIEAPIAKVANIATEDGAAGNAPTTRKRKDK